ncbi:hypothetical protein [Saccharibacillus kuerlensis]|uniref:DUF2834 domain-containing protein n=1 Tax=Saccharibacillus kuerlensis TaxID=459527 RepID=A0ABQ2L866_9BACL|nr:hypothetical protein [Saccharibacillus kuerlensis]GGO06506.1 hypothetical protein GCM10010969_34080 [Saccharibacillus kuerlensis]
MTSISRVLLFVVWLAFVVYALFFAPGAGGGEDPWFGRLLTLQADEPSLLAMFTLLGLFPMTYACLLLRHDDRGVPAWPFVLLSFGLGIFALLPYYILTSHTHAGSHDLRLSEGIRRTAESQVTHGILFLLTLVVMGWGLLAGDLGVYMEAFHTSQFVHIMTIDFFLLTLLSAYAIYTGSRRRWMPQAIALLGFIPILGLLIYVWITRKDESASPYVPRDTVMKSRRRRESSF